MEKKNKPGLATDVLGSSLCFVRNPKQTNLFTQDLGLQKNKHKLFAYSFEAADTNHLVKKALACDSFKSFWNNRYLPLIPDIKSLILFPKDTLGSHYAIHMLENKLPLAPRIGIVPNTPAEYLMRTICLTHDLWHVVTGYDSSLSGETNLQSFYAAQIGGTSSAYLVTSGLQQLAIKDPQRLASALGQVSEAFQRGLKAKFLLGVRWENYLEMPLRNVQTELGL